MRTKKPLLIDKIRHGMFGECEVYFEFTNHRFIIEIPEPYKHSLNVEKKSDAKKAIQDYAEKLTLETIAEWTPIIVLQPKIRIREHGEIILQLPFERYRIGFSGDGKGWLARWLENRDPKALQKDSSPEWWDEYKRMLGAYYSKTQKSYTEYFGELPLWKGKYDHQGEPGPNFEGPANGTPIVYPYTDELWESLTQIDTQLKSASGFINQRLADISKRLATPEVDQISALVNTGFQLGAG